MVWFSEASLGGECRGCVTPPQDDLQFSNTTGIRLVLPGEIYLMSSF